MIGDFNSSVESHLRELDLTGNNLTTFTRKTMPSLTTLQLGYNPTLTNFSNNSMGQLKYLSLESTGLIYFDNYVMDPLVELNFSQNVLTSFSNNFFKDLARLDLSNGLLEQFENNDITSLE